MSTGVNREKTNKLISLRAARVSSGYTVEEAAKYMNISPGALCEYERDASEMPVSAAVKILKLYQFPVDIVYFGSEFEFIKSRNRS